MAKECSKTYSSFQSKDAATENICTNKWLFTLVDVNITKQRKKLIFHVAGNGKLTNSLESYVEILLHKSWRVIDF
jgi:hypothetical protein